MTNSIPLGIYILPSLSQIKCQDGVVIANFLFGLLTLAAYLDQRRSARQTATLAKWAELNLTKSISESDIRTLLKQKVAMEEEITRRIPALARAAVLREQIDLHERALAEHAIGWQSATKELNLQAGLSGIDSNLQDAIFDRIVPRHIRQERRDRLRTRVAVLCIVLAVSSSLFPVPISTVMGILLAIPIIQIAFRLYVLNEGFDHAFKVLCPWCYRTWLLVAAALCLGGILALSYASTARLAYYYCVINH